MRQRLREDWRATSDVAKAVIVLVATVFVVYAGYVFWIYVAFDF